jgi:hypothetical protein
LAAATIWAFSRKSIARMMMDASRQKAVIASMVRSDRGTAWPSSSSS